MFPEVIGYTKVNGLTLSAGRSSPMVEKFTRSSLYHLDFPLKHYVFQFAQEFFYVLEIAVNGCKANVGDFV
jgi:hypothetical protein